VGPGLSLWDGVLKAESSLARSGGSLPTMLDLGEGVLMVQGFCVLDSYLDDWKSGLALMDGKRVGC